MFKCGLRRSRTLGAGRFAAYGYLFALRRAAAECAAAASAAFENAATADDGKKEFREAAVGRLEAKICPRRSFPP